MRALSLPLFLAFSQPVWAEVPKVVTDIAPVHALVAMVMGDLAAPEVLLPRGADPHDFQLRPSQAQSLSEAALVIWVGPELSPWLTRGLDGLGAQARSVPLLAAAGTETRKWGDATEAHDHSAHGHDDHKEEAAQDDHGHDDHAHDDHGHDDHGHDDHAHDKDGIDPHAWLDPVNARTWLEVIAAELSALDPENAPVYAANAAAGRAEIDLIEAQVATTLAPVKDTPFAVFHDAYGYFVGHFGLQVLGSLREGDAAAPGAAHIKELEARLKAEGAVCLFPEANHGSASAAQLAEATGLRLGGMLDPEGTTLEPGPELYGALIQGLATTLAACLAQG
ncbi:zinc ABC transporter substrate-binding protein [Pseudorhodobacter sp. E13]|uniref:zinc ABC transporter substrate-binding protein n=1 Tax=Pseudorhodobacter sp. E13 TaxID=2487931 RepID=UPI000F8E8FB9|nr:zinc ABC transporter substrate-binding protein [Pseudorhodobacter sp. E13]RUS60773.1 zinc ABC transporter substrate-binding protein [Pseudorhodobacter sp. E13]